MPNKPNPSKKKQRSVSIALVATLCALIGGAAWGVGSFGRLVTGRVAVEHSRTVLRATSDLRLHYVQNAVAASEGELSARLAEAARKIRERRPAGLRELGAWEGYVEAERALDGLMARAERESSGDPALGLALRDVGPGWSAGSERLERELAALRDALEAYEASTHGVLGSWLAAYAAPETDD